MGYIYKIVNRINQMTYIGQTIKERATDRYSQHRYLARHPEQEKGNSYIHSAMRDYGLDNFSFEIIEQVNNNLLNEREKYWIKQYDCIAPKGYNLTEGGARKIGFSHSQTIEEKEKRRKSNKKFYINHPEAIETQRERTKKLWENEEYRKKVTESNRKYYAEHPDKFKGKNNPFYGKHHTEESKQKIREAASRKKLKIAQLDKDTLEIIKIHNGVKDAEKELGVSHGWISKAAKQDKVAYGYKWKFM